MPLRDDADPADVMALFRNEGTLIFEGAWTWEIEGRRYDLGLMHQIVAQARLADVQPPHSRSIRLVPGEDNSIVHRLGSVLPADSAPTAAAS